MTYHDQLAQRKQAAEDAEAASVEHFGPDAKDCANWDRLWKRGLLDELVNPSHTDTYEPKGLPADGAGGWVSEDCRTAWADPPSVYSRKYLFHFAKKLADSKVDLMAYADDYLEYADAMDCDQLTPVIDELTTALSSPELRHISGRGYVVEMGYHDPTKPEAYFRNWKSKEDDAGMFITEVGVAIPNHSVVPAEVARGKLQAVRQQIEARQQQLQAEATTQRATVGLALSKKEAVREPKIAKLAQGIEPDEVRTMLTNLGLGSTYDNPGEWAAAFRALLVARVLTGNAPSAFRWAVQHVRADDKMLETFKKAWQNELSEAGQFANDAQKTVFRTVQASAQRLLNTKGHE